MYFLFSYLDTEKINILLDFLNCYVDISCTAHEWNVLNEHSISLFYKTELKSLTKQTQLNTLI